ncbi:MAG: hypothetical protein WCJ30_00005, partial [Deltaproteobacteria bacterium]
NVMVLGTGEMAALTVKNLKSAGAVIRYVVSNSRERAEKLAAECGAEWVSSGSWEEKIPEVDIFITATSCPYPIVKQEQVKQLMNERRHRPLFLIDIAVPRNVEATVHQLDDVYLYNVDDLKSVADRNLKHRGREIEKVEAMVEKAKAFYAALFGWTFQDMDMGPGGKYRIIQLGGTGIGGIMKQPPGMENVPSHWLSYVSVPDVDASCAAAKGGGGQVPWGPVDVEGVGRMATVCAFDGATISVMRPTPRGDAPPAGRPKAGEFCWETLSTADVDRAKTFWTSVMPWKTSTGGGMATFAVGEGMDNQVADIQTARGPVPPNWLTFVVVDRIEPAAEKATKLGGKVMMPAMAIPTIGRIAVILDDQGAALGLFEAAS